MKRKTNQASDVLLVFVTVPNGRAALKLSRLLVDGRLAACLNILPKIRSRYWWKGKVETAAEELLVVKTKRSHWARLESMVRKHHPYKVCEVVAVSLTRGSAPYLKWISESLGSVPRKR